MFMVSHSQDIHEYSLPAFDVSEASFEQTKTLTELSTEPKDVEFNTDGTKMFILDTSSIYVYTLSTAFDISTASYDNYAFSTADYETGLKTFDFSDDGKVMIILGNVDDTFHEYYLSTGFDLTTASHVSSLHLLVLSLINNLKVWHLITLVPKCFFWEAPILIKCLNLP